MEDVKWEEYTVKVSQEIVDRWIRIYAKMEEDFLKSMIKKHCSWHQKLRIWLNVKLGWRFIKTNFIEAVSSFSMDVDHLNNETPFVINNKVYGVKINGKTHWM